MLHSETIGKIAPEIVNLQAEIAAVPKNATNPHFKSKYATLTDIVEAVKPQLHKHGLSVVQTFEPSERDGYVNICTTLLHKSGEWISGTLSMPLGRGDGPQATGSAITYARRYTLSALLGVVSDEDDDGNKAEGTKEQKRPKASDADDPLEGL